MVGCTAIVIALGVGYAAWVAVAGPEHITGPAQPATAIAGVTIDPLGLVVPTIDQHFTFGHAALGDSLVALRDPNWNIVFDSPVENGSYVGAPLLIALVVGAIVLRRRWLALFCAAMGAIALVLSMGSHLHVDGHRTGIPLPFIVIEHLPLLNSSVASRWVTYFWLFAALLLALIVDAVYKAVAKGRFGQRGAVVWSAVLAVVVLVPLLPAWPYATAPAAVPPWFTSGARSLPAGSAALVYPLASSSNDSSMLWQAMANMQFRQPGGFAVIPGSDGANTFNGDPSPCKRPWPSAREERRRWTSRRRRCGPNYDSGAPRQWPWSRARPVRPAPRRSSPEPSARRVRREASSCGRTSTAGREPRPASRDPAACGPAHARRADVRQHGAMAHDHRFRFAAQLSTAPEGTARSWADQARKAEDLGYSALLMPDHFGDQLAPVPALAAVAAATTTLRMGSLVFGNDYRHPFVLAKEAATLDVLSEGRFEMSLGAGWMRSDYDEAGLTYDHPAVRVARFEEAVKVVQGLLRTDGPFNFHGEHYEVLGPHTHAPPRAEARAPAHHRRGWQAGPLLRRPARRHRQHQRQPPRGHRRRRDGRRRHARADPHQGRLGEGGGG